MDGKGVKVCRGLDSCFVSSTSIVSSVFMFVFMQGALLLQACRGNEFDNGIFKLEDDAIGESKPQQRLVIPMEADVLYAYSTVPGMECSLHYEHLLYM